MMPTRSYVIGLAKYSDRNISDEFHYVLESSAIEESRQTLLRHHFLNRQNIFKFQDLMNINNPFKLCILCMLIIFICLYTTVFWFTRIKTYVLR